MKGRTPGTQGRFTLTRTKTTLEGIKMSAIRKLGAPALGAIAVAGTVGCPGAGTTTAHAAEFEFKLHHFLGGGRRRPHRLMLEPWAQSIMEASAGASRSRFFRRCRWAAAPQLPRQVRDGVVDMALDRERLCRGVRPFPRTEVFELPGEQGSSAA